MFHSFSTLLPSFPKTKMLGFYGYNQENFNTKIRSKITLVLLLTLFISIAVTPYEVNLKTALQLILFLSAVFEPAVPY